MVEKTIHGITVKVDRTLCIGSGNCVNIAPEFFELDEHNLSSILENPQKIDKQKIIEACEVCPTNALIVINDMGVQLVPRTTTQ